MSTAKHIIGIMNKQKASDWKSPQSKKLGGHI